MSLPFSKEQVESFVVKVVAVAHTHSQIDINSYNSCKGVLHILFNYSILRSGLNNKISKTERSTKYNFNIDSIKQQLNHLQCKNMKNILN